MSYTLTFSQLVGEFVTDKELLGAQDPYVVFEAGGRKSQTKVSFREFIAERAGSQAAVRPVAIFHRTLREAMPEAHHKKSLRQKNQSNSCQTPNDAAVIPGAYARHAPVAHHERLPQGASRYRIAKIKNACGPEKARIGI